MSDNDAVLDEDAVAAARELVAKADAVEAAKADEARAARAKLLEPVRTFATSDAVGDLLEAATEHHEAFADDDQIAPHLFATIVGLTNLRDALARA